MNINRKFGMMAAAVVYVGIAALNPAGAAVLPADFNGMFSKDNDVQFFAITLEGPKGDTTPLAISTGYVNGGFDPILTLFAADGTKLASNDDDLSVDPPNPDSVLSVNLLAGAYTLALTQWDNFAVGPKLSDGFQNDSDPNFTANNGCFAGTYFCDFAGHQRTGNWAVHIEGEGFATLVPVPATLPLLASGIGGLVLFFRRRSGSGRSGT